jgi:HEAT repeat protein
MSLDELITELRTVALSNNKPDDLRLHELKQALQAQGAQGLRGAVELLRDPDLRVSEIAADILEMIPGEAVAEELVAYALNHLTDPTGRSKMPGPGWRRLRRLGKAILPALCCYYSEQPSFDTRLAMIHIVQQIGDPAGLPLLEMALTDADPRLVEAAGEALGQVDGAGAYDHLTRLLDSENVQYRLGAIRGLGLLKNSAAVEPLLNVLLAHNQPYVQWESSPTGTKLPSLQHAAAEAIDTLTGEPLRGDVARIRCWIRKGGRMR